MARFIDWLLGRTSDEPYQKLEMPEFVPPDWLTDAKISKRMAEGGYRVIEQDGRLRIKAIGMPVAVAPPVQDEVKLSADDEAMIASIREDYRKAHPDHDPGLPPGSIVTKDIDPDKISWRRLRRRPEDFNSYVIAVTVATDQLLEATGLRLDDCLVDPTLGLCLCLGGCIEGEERYWNRSASWNVFEAYRTGWKVKLWYAIDSVVRFTKAYAEGQRLSHDTRALAARLEKLEALR